MSGGCWLLAAALGVALSHAAGVAAEPIDLNAAPLAQLQELPGIGPKKAEAIVTLRQRRPFSRVSQLLEVRGIGKKTLERLKPLVRVGPASTGSSQASYEQAVGAVLAGVGVPSRGTNGGPAATPP